MSDLLQKLADCIEFGKINKAAPYPPQMKGMDGADEITKQALDEGVNAQQILTDGLMVGMEKVGVKFRENKVFVPQVLMSAKAMSTAMIHLKPYFLSGEVKQKGTFIIGTVEGDLHDIGKNLVGMMLEGAGFEIIDLGTDVAPQKFVQAVQEQKPDIVGLSALLTTTMTSIQATIEALQAAGVRDQVKVMVGGAPITQDFADKVGADGYAPDAGSAARIAKSLLGLA